MADYFIAQTAAGLGDGSSPENAIAESSVTWSARTNDTNYLVGTFTGIVSVDADGNADNDRMVIRGDYPGYTCTITNSGGAGLSVAGNYHSYYGITVDGCSGAGIRFATGKDISGIDLNDCSSINNGGNGVSWTQTALFSLNDITFTGCTVTDNGGTGMFLATTNTGAASALTNLAIRNTNVLRNTNNSLKLGNSGIASKNHTGLIIDNVNASACVGPNGGSAVDGFTASAHWVNYITKSTFNENYGPNGGMNVLHCDYFHIFKNQANGNFAYSDSTLTTPTIDGNGILIDNSCTEIECYQNECSNNTGNTTNENSGCGIMMLGATSSRVFGNWGTGNRAGLYLGGTTHTGSAMCGNIFAENIDFGYYVANPVADNVTLIYGNILTGNGTSTGFYRNTGVDQTNEDYNYFFNFTTDSTNHTLGTNTKTTDPDIDVLPNLSPSSTCIGTGYKWWSGSNPESATGEPFSDFDIDIGGVQSTYSPFHPENL